MGKIMVTGGAGYLGCILVDELVKSDMEIIVVDPGWFPSGMDYIRNIFGGKPFPTLRVIRKSILTPSDFEDVDTVCHLGGLSNDPMAAAFPHHNMTINYTITKRTAEMAKEAGVGRFIFASTASVYDNIGKGTEIHEWNDAPDSSDYPYSNTKLLAEKYLTDLHTPDFQVALLRQGTLWGYSPRMRYDLVVNTMLRDGLLNRRITSVVPENNKPHHRPICHVRDCAQVYMDLISADEWSSDLMMLNVVAENIDIGQLASRVDDLIKTLGIRPEIKYVMVPKVRNYMCTTLPTCIRKVPTFVSADIQEITDNLTRREVHESYHPETRNIDWLNLIMNIEKPFMN